MWKQVKSVHSDFRHYSNSPVSTCRLPCYVFCICLLNIRNTNQLSWAINYVPSSTWSGRDFGSEAMHVVDKAFVHNLFKFYMHISYRLVGQKGFDFRKKNKARWESWCPTQASITSQLRRQEMKNQPKLPPNCTDAATLHWCNTGATPGTPNCSDAATPSTSISLGWKSHNCATNIHHKLPHLTFSKSTKLWFS